MAVKQALRLCFGLALLLSVTAQTVLPAAAKIQAASAPAPSYVAPGVSNPTICAEGDETCRAALVQPANETDYVNCINNPTAPLCTSSSSEAATESAASPEDSCPTDPILDQGFTEAQLEIQVRVQLPRRIDKTRNFFCWFGTTSLIRAICRWPRVSMQFVKTLTGSPASTPATIRSGELMSSLLLEVL